MTDNNEIKTVTFDGFEYKIEDLTPNAIEGFNMLVKLQQEIANISYDLRVNQAAQKLISEELKTTLKEENIQYVEKKEK
jgi:hypothetical protein